MCAIRWIPVIVPVIEGTEQLLQFTVNNVIAITNTFDVNKNEMKRKRNKKYLLLHFHFLGLFVSQVHEFFSPKITLCVLYFIFFWWFRLTFKWIYASISLLYLSSINVSIRINGTFASCDGAHHNVKLSLNKIHSIRKGAKYNRSSLTTSTSWSISTYSMRKSIYIYMYISYRMYLPQNYWLLTHGKTGLFSVLIQTSLQTGGKMFDFIPSLTWMFVYIKMLLLDGNNPNTELQRTNIH